MSRRTSKKAAGPERPADLTLFPVDRGALERLAQILTPAKLQQSRLTTIATILALLEPLIEEIDRMEAIATSLNPAHPDLIKTITEMRKTVEQFNALLRDSFRWT